MKIILPLFKTWNINLKTMFYETNVRAKMCFYLSKIFKLLYLFYKIILIIDSKDGSNFMNYNYEWYDLLNKATQNTALMVTKKSKRGCLVPARCAQAAPHSHVHCTFTILMRILSWYTWSCWSIRSVSQVPSRFMVAVYHCCNAHKHSVLQQHTHTSTPTNEPMQETRESRRIDVYINNH